MDRTKICAPSWWCLALLSLALSTTIIEAFSSPHHDNSVSLSRSRHLFSSNSDELLEKARKLREDVARVESSKEEVQMQKEAQERAKRKEEQAAQARKGKERMRYSAEVPILKDMGDEVMERVDFPPRLKGGECVFNQCLECTLPQQR